MAILRKSEMREMSEDELREKLSQLKEELSSEMGAIAGKRKVSNPGRIREIRKTIARVLTILREKNPKLHFLVAVDKLPRGS